MERKGCQVIEFVINTLQRAKDTDHGELKTSHKDSIFLGVCFVIGDRISCSSGWFQTHYVAEEDLELPTLLHPPPKWWGYRCVSLRPSLTHFKNCAFTGFVVSAGGWTQGVAHGCKYSTTELHCSSILFCFFRDRISLSQPDLLWSHLLPQQALFLILLPQPPK